MLLPSTFPGHFCGPISAVSGQFVSCRPIVRPTAHAQDKSAGEADRRARKPRKFQVLVNAPNTVGYARLGLVAGALFTGTTRPSTTILLFLTNFFLDGLDGVLARQLRQETSFGAVLDVSTDILSRGLLWAWALDGPLAALPILLECFTFTSTYSAGGAGWKTGGCFQGAPAWVRSVMGFRTPAGCLAIAGLMGCPLWIWAARYAGDSLWAHPGLGIILGSGRLLAASVEVWAIIAFMQGLVIADCLT